MGKEKKRGRTSSTGESVAGEGVGSDADSECEKRKLKKLKRKLRREQRRAARALRKKLKAERRKLKKCERSGTGEGEKGEPEPAAATANVPVELMERSKKMAPMTKEEWEKRQSVVRRVLDEESGRYRLIKGDGEVLEEIVSRDQHRQINQRATQADGAYFQAQTVERKRL